MVFWMGGKQRETYRVEGAVVLLLAGQLGCAWRVFYPGS
jgi:hypothetical protein